MYLRDNSVLRTRCDVVSAFLDSRSVVLSTSGRGFCRAAVWYHYYRFERTGDPRKSFPASCGLRIWDRLPAAHRVEALEPTGTAPCVRAASIYCPYCTAWTENSGTAANVLSCPDRFADSKLISARHGLILSLICPC